MITNDLLCCGLLCPRTLKESATTMTRKTTQVRMVASSIASRSREHIKTYSGTVLSGMCSRAMVGEDTVTTTCDDSLIAALETLNQREP